MPGSFRDGAAFVRLIEPIRGPMRLSARLFTALAIASLAACGDDDPSGPDPLVVPTGLTTSSAVGTPSTATITWRDVPAASGYVLQRAAGATGGTFAQQGGTLTDTVYVDNTVAQ